MNNYSIAENFNKYFRVRFASTKELMRIAFNIRYGVYAEELGWEPENQLKMEMDDFDNYAFHCLLEHRTTQTYAGCIRLVIPPLSLPNSLLPFEKYCLTSADPTIIDSSQFQRGTFGEISRLAVLNTFRRRLDEQDKPFVIGDIVEKSIFSEEERRNFPNIALGLYLAIIALADLCNHQGMFMMMEPRLKRRLQKFGLNFIQSGNEMDYHGQRALFYFPMQNPINDLAPELKELYQIIYADLKHQTAFLPFANPTDH